MAISQAQKARAIKQAGLILMQLPEVRERFRGIQDKEQARALNKRLIDQLGTAADQFDQINVGEDIEVQNYLAQLQDFIKRQQGGQLQANEKAPQPTFDPFAVRARTISGAQLRAGQVPKLASPFEREQQKLEREKIGIRREELGVRQEVEATRAETAKARLEESRQRRKLNARFQKIKLGLESEKISEKSLSDAQKLQKDFVDLNEDPFKRATRTEEGQELIDDKIEQLKGDIERARIKLGREPEKIKSFDEIIEAAGKELVDIATAELTKDLRALGQNKQTIGQAEFKRRLVAVIEEIQNQ